MTKLQPKPVINADTPPERLEALRLAEKLRNDRAVRRADVNLRARVERPPKNPRKVTKHRLYTDYQKDRMVALRFGSLTDFSVVVRSYKQC